MGIKLKILFFLLFIFGSSISAQYYSTDSGYVGLVVIFPPDTIIIESKSTEVNLDMKNGKFVIYLPVSSCSFQEDSMMNFFKVNIFESSKFPRVTFRGKINGFASIDYNTPGNYEILIDGLLTIRGIDKTISTLCYLDVYDKVIQITSSFDINLSDYNIKVDDISTKIMNNVINVNLDFLLFQKH